jgi:hypothetical protein
MFDGCPGCEARAVNEPLARPAVELPFYGRSVFVGAVGMLTIGIFAASTIVALLEKGSFTGFWSIVSAAETASWRLKFGAPLALIGLWAGIRLYRSIVVSRGKIAGVQVARAGLTLSVLTAFLFVTTIGITLPERWRQHDRGLTAGEEAKAWAFKSLQLQYMAKYGTFPADVEDLRKLPDPDCSNAALLSTVDAKGYQPRSELASVSIPKSRGSRTQGGDIIGNRGITAADDPRVQRVPFTSFELRLPGPDGIVGTDDDTRVTDGVVTTASETKESSSVETNNP